jgi:hypothetical protein
MEATTIKDQPKVKKVYLLKSRTIHMVSRPNISKKVWRKRPDASIRRRSAARSRRLLPLRRKDRVWR